MSSTSGTPAAQQVSSTPGQKLAIAAVLICLAGLLSLHLDSAPITHKAELRCHEIVQGMLDSGDWLVPRRSGEIWLNKPPLLYWTAASLATVQGGYSLATLRAPSLIAALLLVYACYRWGRSLGGVGMGLLAATLLMMMTEIHSRGREGTAELLLCLLINLAYITFDRLHHGKLRSLWPFALLLTLAFLAKATSGLLSIGLPITLYLAWRQRLRAALSPKVLAWITAGILGGVSWYVLLVIVEPGAWMRFKNAALLPLGLQTEAQAMLRSATHYEPWYAQLPNLLNGAAPVSLLLPLVLWRGWVTRFWREQPRLRLLGLIVCSLLVAFSLLPQKRPHYLLPTLPALAILSAEAILAVMAIRPRWLTLASRSAALLFLVLGGTATWAVDLWLGEVLQWPLASAGPWVVLAGLLTVVGGLAGFRGRLRTFGLAATLSWLGLLGLYHGSIDPLRQQLNPDFQAHHGADELAHWRQLKDRYPVLLHSFRIEEDKSP